ncbi:VanZ family protein [Abyssalbus ytuae]|uniref:VanZ family protein n=1 Tax=Abyssalbus ytuae TaxID=2926907 RepID=A0A9E7A0Z6_9FLAO|nr:VanZ family protein [Abyssalbus ytuae]UOB18982.1 VanZ family protein [Abyssalbus ytuae]
MHRNKRLFFFLGILWTCAVTFMSLYPFKDDLPDSFFNLPFKDKIAHFCFYFGFTVLWYYYFKSIGIKKSLEVSIILAILYGILMEIMQYAMGFGRMMDVKDIIANILGSVFALIIIKGISYRCSH